MTATACFWQSCDCYFVREGLADTIFGQQCTARACRCYVVHPASIGMWRRWYVSQLVVMDNGDCFGRKRSCWCHRSDGVLILFGFVLGSGC